MCDALLIVKGYVKYSMVEIHDNTSTGENVSVYNMVYGVMRALMKNGNGVDA